jgi:pyruvate formate lyase activating enzyme
MTTVRNLPALDYARRLSALGCPMWLRFVLVPGLTDGYDNVEKADRTAPVSMSASVS